MDPEEITSPDPKMTMLSEEMPTEEEIMWIAANEQGVKRKRSSLASVDGLSPISKMPKDNVMQ